MRNGRGHHRSFIVDCKTVHSTRFSCKFSNGEERFYGNEGRRDSRADLTSVLARRSKKYSPSGEISRPYGRVRGVR